MAFPVIEMLLIGNLAKENKKDATTDKSFYQELEQQYSILYFCLIGIFVILLVSSLSCLYCFWYVSSPSIARVNSLPMCVEFDFLPAGKQAAATTFAMSATL